MSTPEIVLGASLLTLFLNTTAVFQLGFVTIFIAHVMFIVSFIVVTVKARLIGFDRHLEEAAMDLGANEIDDVPQGDASTHRTRDARRRAARVRPLDRRLRDHLLQCGQPTQTFPVFVWGIARVAVPPQINVVASAIFLVAIALALA